jgi:uncharacterized protein involved in exopolysaccharide biosynthesis
MARFEAQSGRFRRASRFDRGGEGPAANQGHASAYALDPMAVSPPQPRADEPVGIGEFGAILRRRWKTIFATTALVTTLGLGYAFVAKSSYTATTAIFVDPRARASFVIEGSGTGAGYDPNLVDSQILLIASDTVLRRVIETEKLKDDAEFTKGPGDPSANVLKNLQLAVKVKRPDRTYVVEIQVATESAEKSARIANAIARAYLSDGRDSKSETAQREQTWLETHLRNLQNRLNDAEARVETYKADNKILGVEGTLVGEQQLGEINKGLVDAQRKAAEAKAALDQVEALRKRGLNAATTTEALKSPVIDRLRGQLGEIARLDANARSTLGPRHPAAIEVRQQMVEAQRLIDEELGRIAAGARSAYEVARGNVIALERQLERSKTDTTGVNAKLLRLRELERAVEAQKAVYEKFLRDKEQIARLTVDTPAGRVIAPAIAPQRRSWPNRPLILALSMIGGLFLGVGLALLRETLSRGSDGSRQRLPDRSAGSGFFRRREAGPDDSFPGGVQPHLLAMLPPQPAVSGMRWIRGRQSAAFARVALDQIERDPHSPYAREIVLLAQRIAGTLDAAPATLLVTGAGGDQGSPVLAANLARALASQIGPVLLIDGVGGPASLSHRFASAGSPVEIMIGGQPRLALKLETRAGAPLYFLPFGGVAPPAGGRKIATALPARLILIDGPAFDSRAMERVDIDKRIDGVIALLPAGAAPADRIAGEIDARFGASLIGLVGQAGISGRAA